MANTSSRTLRLLSLLQSRRFWPGPQLAERLGVSDRTLRRDVDRLRELGYPVNAQPGVDGGYALAAGTALPPLLVDDDEAMALAVAIWSQLAGGDLSSTGDDAGLRALTKIVSVMPRRLRTRLDAVRASTVPGRTGRPRIVLDQATLATLALACRDAERVELDYRAADGTASTRRIEPHRLVPLGRRWYLVAYDLSRHDWRTLRIDRITRAGATGVAFAPRRPPFEDVGAWVAERVAGGATGGALRAEAVVAAPASRVGPYVGRWGDVRPEGPDRCRLIMDTDTVDWPLFVLGAVGAPFTVVGPPELAAAATDWAARFAVAVASPSHPGNDRETAPA